MAAEGQLFAAVAVGQETVVADALEAGRQRCCRKRRMNSPAETVITLLGFLRGPGNLSTAKVTWPLFSAEDALVGNGYAMSVAPEVFRAPVAGRRRAVLRRPPIRVCGAAPR